MKSDRYDPIAAALEEDIGQGDITTDFLYPRPFLQQDALRRVKMPLLLAREPRRKSFDESIPQ